MKLFPLKLVAISISIICILSIGAVSALTQDEASVMASWLSPKYYQGDTASVRIFFQSNVADELQITRISIHFDWMPSDAFYSSDLSANPVTIQGLGSYPFELTNIQFLAGATAGNHSYYVSVDYVQNGANGVWNSPSLTLQIYDGNEKIYDQLNDQVNNRINNATYSSSEAQSLLQQAQSAYNNASSLAIEKKWQEAVTSLQTASDYLDQADATEQRSGGQTGSLLLYLIIAAIAVVAALTVIGVAVLRRRKKPEAPAEHVEPDAVA
jgi:hypothetical protein